MQTRVVYSARDDVEALAYTLLAFQTPQKLPWETPQISDCEDEGSPDFSDEGFDVSSHELYKCYEECREVHLPKVLEGAHPALQEFTKYVRGLEANDDVGYESWAEVFGDALKSLGTSEML